MKRLKKNYQPPLMEVVAMGPMMILVDSEKINANVNDWNKKDMGTYPTEEGWE